MRSIHLELIERSRDELILGIKKQRAQAKKIVWLFHFTVNGNLYRFNALFDKSPTNFLPL